IFMVQALAERVKNENLSIVCVSTSKATEELALSLGLTMKDLAEISEIDLTIDGADEISPDFHGIKGGGGALLYEKIVATNSEKNIWIVDDSKLVDTLGKFPLPVEVVDFGNEHLFRKFVEKGYQPEYRKDETGSKFITDSGNLIIDLYLEKIEDPEVFANELKNEVGVVEHGLFIDIVDQVIAGTPDGKIEIETK